MKVTIYFSVGESLVQSLTADLNTNLLYHEDVPDPIKQHALGEVYKYISERGDVGKITIHAVMYKNEILRRI
jgi:hypothetical protein